MSWQPGACTACCADGLSERADPHNWPPPASGFRTQTLMSARGVALRPAWTAVSSTPATGGAPVGPHARVCLRLSPSPRYPSLLSPLSFSSHKVHLSWELGSASRPRAGSLHPTRAPQTEKGRSLVQKSHSLGKVAQSHPPSSEEHAVSGRAVGSAVRAPWQSRVFLVGDQRRLPGGGSLCWA